MAFPADGMELTHILVVGDLERARRWYEDVLGASRYREYGGEIRCFFRDPDGHLFEISQYG
jgi:catechol 2,3-dioxygenase-like lactoylglutathione lyase family enzyme